MPSSPTDLEQTLFDTLAEHIDAANDLSTKPDAAARLLEIAAHCTAAAEIARVADRLLNAHSEPAVDAKRW